MPAAQKASEVRRADLFPQGGERVVVFVQALRGDRERACVVNARSQQVTHVIEDDRKLVDGLVMPQQPLELTGMGCVAELAANARTETAGLPLPKPDLMAAPGASSSRAPGDVHCPFGQQWNSVAQQCEFTGVDPLSVVVIGPTGPTPEGVPDPMALRQYTEVLSDRAWQFGLRGHLVCDALGLGQSPAAKQF